MSCKRPLLSFSQDYVSSSEHPGSAVFSNVGSHGAGADLSDCRERRGEGAEGGQQVQPLWTLIFQAECSSLPVSNHWS